MSLKLIAFEALLPSGLNSIVVLFQIFKCLVPGIVDKYKCRVFANSREYVQETVFEFLPFTCIVLASVS